MKKIYALIASALMMLPFSASAQTMTTDNTVLTDWGYRLEKDVNFVEGTVNETPIVPSHSITWGAVESYKINKQAVTRFANEGLEFMGVNVAGNGIDWPEGKGLRSTRNERWIVVNDLRVGQIVALDISNTDTVQFVVNSDACNDGTGWADNLVDPLIVEPISGSVHEIQELAEEGSADTYRYFKVINEGPMYAKFNGKTPSFIYRMQIWSKNDDPEAVSSPSLKMVGVNGDARNIEFKPGVSTYGNEVKTYYAFEGNDPVYLKDSEEIDHYEYTYEVDAEGNPVLDENGNPVKADSTAVYKQVIDLDSFAEVGEYGDNLFNPEDGAVSVSANDDEDGDGIVIVKAASVSSEGTLSQIVTINVSIGEIQLNAPTLTLVNFSGKERAYKIGWTNNTLCGEEYQIICETGEGSYIEYEANTGIGDIVSSAESLKVTVKVSGYTDGVCELAEVDASGVDVKTREGLGNGMNPEHNWDFCVFTEEVRQMINEEVIDRYVIRDDEGNVVKEYTVEQVDGDEVPEEDIDKLEKIVKYFGWDGLDSRKTGRHWRTWVPEYEVIEDSVTENIISTAYAEDQTGLLNGLVADNDHPSYSTMAIFTTGEGLFYMSKGTIQVEGVAYGEYVAVTTDAGTTISQHLDAENPFSVTIGSNRFVKSIDVYTYDDLPDGMECIAAPSASQRTAIYNANGIEVKTPAKGMHIIRKADGTRVKVMF